MANSSGVPVPLSDDVQARITRNRESAFLKLRATRNRRAAVLKLRATRNRNAALLKLRKKKFLYRAKPTQVSKAPMQVSSPTISTGAVTLQVVVPERPIVRAPPAPPHLSTFPQSPDPLKSTSTPTQVPVPLPVPTSSVIADFSVEVQSAVRAPVHSVSTYGSRWKLLHLPGLPLKNTLNKCWYHAGLHLLSTIPALRTLCSSPPKGIRAFEKRFLAAVHAIVLSRRPFKVASFFPLVSDFSGINNRYGQKAVPDFLEHLFGQSPNQAPVVKFTFSSKLTCSKCHWSPNDCSDDISLKLHLPAGSNQITLFDLVNFNFNTTLTGKDAVLWKVST